MNGLRFGLSPRQRVTLHGQDVSIICMAILMRKIRENMYNIKNYAKNNCLMVYRKTLLLLLRRLNTHITIFTLYMLKLFNT